MHLASLRIYARHHVLDRTVFASGIQGLKDHKQGVRVIRVKNILLAGQLFNIQPEFCQSLLFIFKIPAVRRVEIFL